MVAEAIREYAELRALTLVKARPYRERQQAAIIPWSDLARPSQRPPDGSWRFWLLMAGRGFGKTRTGAEYIREEAMAGRAAEVMLIAATAADVRDVVVEGPSGIVKVCERAGWRVRYEPSKQRITFPNGAIARTRSADEPDRIRGPEADLGWWDEFGTWKHRDAYTNADFGLRRIGPNGERARAVITFTPKPQPLVRELITRTDAVLVGGSTLENADNLDPATLAAYQLQYAGTRLGRQELEGELLEDVEGALWTLGLIDRSRIARVPEDVTLVSCVVGVDPAATSNPDSNETGIIVAARGSDGHGYVLADYSLRGSPNAWGGAAVQAYRDWRADHVTPETNNGGEMVTQTLYTIEPNLPITPVHASRGKATRAEPIAALYEQGRIHHVGAFPELEDQMVTWVPGMLSPDRMDALVWALSDVMLDLPGEFTDLPAETLAWLRREFDE